MGRARVHARVHISVLVYVGTVHASCEWNKWMFGSSIEGCRAQQSKICGGSDCVFGSQNLEIRHPGPKVCDTVCTLHCNSHLWCDVIAAFQRVSAPQLVAAACPLHQASDVTPWEIGG